MGFAGVPDVTDTPGFMLWQTFAAQLGLRIHVQYYDGDTSVADAVVAGNVQIGEGGLQAVIAADEAAGNSSGSYPFIIWGTYEATDDFGLIVNNAYPTISSLAGKPVACSSSGSTSCTFASLMLTAGGVPPSQQDILYAGGTPSRYSAMLQGKAAADVSEPFYMVDAVERGNFHIAATVPASEPDLLFSSIYSSRSFYNAHPDIVLKVEEATMMADRWAHNETAWVQKEQEEFPGTNQTIAGAAWSIWMAMNMWAPNGGLSASNMNFSMNFFYGLLELNYPLAPTYWSTLSVQQQAEAALGGPYTTCPVLTGCTDSNIPSLHFTIPGVTS